MTTLVSITCSLASYPENQIISRQALGLTFLELYPSNRYGTGPNLAIAGFSGYNGGEALKKFVSTFQWRDDFSRVVGPHVLKFGALVIRAREDNHSQGSITANTNDNGTVTFNTFARNIAGLLWPMSC